MRCPVCSAIEGQGDCPECRALAREISANSAALATLRREELPSTKIQVPRVRRAGTWMAAAAALLLAAALPILRQTATAPQRAGPVPHRESEVLKVKILTPDPDVVIYWLIDDKEGDQR